MLGTKSKNVVLLLFRGFARFHSGGSAFVGRQACREVVYHKKSCKIQLSIVFVPLLQNYILIGVLSLKLISSNILSVNL